MSDYHHPAMPTIHCRHQSIGYTCYLCTEDDIADVIDRANRAYRAGAPEMSDINYDRLEAKLRAMNPKHPLLRTVG